MAKYRDTSNDLGFECPYCGQMTEHNDWSDRGLDIENERMECDFCEKPFLATIEKSFSFDSVPTCILNGELHNFIDDPDNEENIMVCDKCGEYEWKEKGEK